MPRLPTRQLITLISIALAGCLAPEGQSPGFEARDSEGRECSLATLSSNRPVLLYFIERHCPCSRLAAVHLQRLQDAYGDAIEVVGVIDAPAEDARAWRRQTGFTFRVLPDPWCDIIHAYKVERSVHTVLIAQGGRIAKAYPAYNASSLADLNDRVAGLLGIQARSISTEGAPTKLTAGCTFPE